MDVNDVADAILSNPDVQEKAMSYVHQTHYPDMAAEEFMANVQPTGREPIYVTDRKDPRLRAYNDSLFLYNKEKKIYENEAKSFSPHVASLTYDKLLSFGPVRDEAPKYGYTYSDKPLYGYKKPVQPVKLKPTYEEFLKTVNPDFIGDDYNLEEAYKNLPYEVTSAWAKDPNKNHLPDTYKLPNHETFSNESIYYKEGMKAGRWEGDNYIPIQPTVVTETKKYTSPKQFYQGRDFMEATGFRPGYFHPEEVEEAKKNKK